MKQTSVNFVVLPLFSLLVAMPAQVVAKASLDMRLRYENVDQNNSLKTANALTLRTRLGYRSETWNQLSFNIEFEDSRTVLGVDNFNNTRGINPNYSVVADPETTELDQAYVNYKVKAFNVKVGRQVIAWDGQRFIGHVGWRQDRQTFDALTIDYTPFEALTFKYGYLTKRNRIFAEQADLDSRDHIINARINTALGQLTAYSYLLELDNGQSNSLDTYGVQLKGQYALEQQPLSYLLEYAMQKRSQAGATDFDADYLRAELGTQWLGATWKLGIESLGSDKGQYGFSTPLATLHKFNGWADQFLATPQQGLDDVYLAVSGKALGGQWQVQWHSYSSGYALTSGGDDLGDELNMLYGRKITDQLKVGVKYAHYQAGDSNANKVDTEKLWLWMQYTL